MVTALAAILLQGCAAQKIRVQASDNIYIANQQTSLVVGLRRTFDARPEADRKSDEKNDRPRDQVTSEQLYKHIRLSGTFKNVLFDKFADEQVDVIITPTVRRFTSGEAADGKTAAALGIALIPVVNIIYMAAGGPISDQAAVIDIELEIKTKDSTKTVSASRTASVTKRLGEDSNSKIGQLEGDTLSDVIRELMSKTSDTIVAPPQR